jgi:ribonuclease M5
MREKLVIREVVIVEGRYDKITLSQVIDAHIIPTEGFAIFHNKEKQALLRRLGEQHGLIVLTDSDGGGGQIRTLLANLLPKDKIKHLYTPAIKGKEKRKPTASKAGLLGVEGMDSELLYNLFLPFAQDAPTAARGREVTKVDFYTHGLSGGAGAQEKRERLAKHLGLPPLTANALLAAINLLYDYDGYLAALAACGITQ